MTGLAFVTAFVIGAVVLAVWFDLRLERRRPVSPTTRLSHAFAAYVVLRVASAGSHALAGSGAPLRSLAVIFLVVLPGLVYAFLAGLWLMRTLAEAARLSRH